VGGWVHWESKITVTTITSWVSFSLPDGLWPTVVSTDNHKSEKQNKTHKQAYINTSTCWSETTVFWHLGKKETRKKGKDDIAAGLLLSVTPAARVAISSPLLQMKEKSGVYASLLTTTAAFKAQERERQGSHLPSPPPFCVPNRPQMQHFTFVISHIRKQKKQTKKQAINQKRKTGRNRSN
jgi:hypothetical protein